MKPTSFDPRNSLWIACLLIILIPFSSCEKQLKEKNKVYEDELRTTNNVELITTDSNEVSCSIYTSSFRITKKNDILKFRATGQSEQTREGKAVAKFHLSNLVPKLSGARTYSVRIHLQGGFQFSNNRFKTGPIIKLIDESVYSFDPTNLEVSTRGEYLTAPKSLTFHIDRGLSNFKVLDGEGQDITKFFVRNNGGKNTEGITLTLGASGDRVSAGPGEKCTTGGLQLDGIEVFAR